MLKLIITLLLLPLFSVARDLRSSAVQGLKEPYIPKKWMYYDLSPKRVLDPLERSARFQEKKGRYSNAIRMYNILIKKYFQTIHTAVMSYYSTPSDKDFLYKIPQKLLYFYERKLNIYIHEAKNGSYLGDAKLKNYFIRKVEVYARIFHPQEKVNDLVLSLKINHKSSTQTKLQKEK